MIDVITLLESGEKNYQAIQNKLDNMTIGINELQDEFYENDSEIETAARDSISETIIYILAWFDMDIDIEDALAEREW